jgi:hypothetical protein
MDDDLEHAAPYMQLGIPAPTFRCEAVSNHYLESPFQLDDAGVEQLLSSAVRPTRRTVCNHARRRNTHDMRSSSQHCWSRRSGTSEACRRRFLVTADSARAAPLESDELPFGLTVTEPVIPAVALTNSLDV